LPTVRCRSATYTLAAEHRYYRTKRDARGSEKTAAAPCSALQKTARGTKIKQIERKTCAAPELV
jgi:hypothetical protein